MCYDKIKGGDKVKSNERILELRKTLGLTQTDFGAKIGLKQAIIGQMENGGRNLTDRTASLICEKYNVNEQWLRTGKGEMFKQTTRDEAIAEFVSRTLSAEDDTFQKRFIAMLSKLSDAQWETLQDMALMIVGQAQPPVPQEQTDFDIEAELSSYRRELEFEKRAKEKSGALPDSKEA